MARQSGHIKYKGTIGDVRHFKIKGLKGHFAGLVGGPTAEQVKNGAEFARTRENNNEFGGSAKAGKAFRQLLNPVAKGVSDSRVTARVTALMKKINLEDGSEARGQRAILVTSRKDLVKGFEFNQFATLDSVLRADYQIEVNDTRSEATVVLKDLNPFLKLNQPTGTTHFRLTFAAAALSDFVYNTDDKVYEPKIKTSNLLTVSYSEYLSIKANAGDVSISAMLENGYKPGEDESLLVCLGVQFFQLVGNQYYPLSVGNCLQIVDCK